MELDHVPAQIESFVAAYPAMDTTPQDQNAHPTYFLNAVFRTLNRQFLKSLSTKLALVSLHFTLFTVFDTHVLIFSYFLTFMHIF